jgi:hypothetical protein
MSFGCSSGLFGAPIRPLCEEFLRPDQLRLLDPIEECINVLRRHSRRFQERVECSHHQHLTTDGFDKDIHTKRVRTTTLSGLSNASRAHSLGVLPARDAASSMTLASTAVSFVLRLSERRSRPRSFSLGRSLIV